MAAAMCSSRASMMWISLALLLYVVYQNVSTSTAVASHQMAHEPSPQLRAATLSSGANLSRRVGGKIALHLPSASAPLPAPPTPVLHNTRSLGLSEAACNSLQCAKRFNKVEPEWAQLSFQPRIDWKAGGLRGDCVAGELE